MIANCPACNEQVMLVRSVIGRTITLDMKPIKKWVRDPDSHIWANCDCFSEHKCNQTCTANLNPPSNSLSDQQGMKTGQGRRALACTPLLNNTTKPILK